ncbi:ribosome-recycling factor, putative [Plasmodium chabaudi adami]|uniref:Ribosome-recycling factor, putative n=1 Tax=Plasmodium chabaudi adami TaxID=5826 RepID=A0A1D3LF73_PLACE|nr:ribosome-recycling factor, putative [Plasmodium chabaudi adami]
MLQKHAFGFAFYFGFIILSIITGIKCVHLKRQINENLFETPQHKYPSFFLGDKHNIKNRHFLKNRNKIKYYNKEESKNKRNNPYLLYGHKKKNKNNTENSSLEQTLKTKVSAKWSQTNKNEKGKGSEINYDEDDEDIEMDEDEENEKKTNKQISKSIKEEIKKKNNETLTLKNCSIKKKKLNNIMDQDEGDSSTPEQTDETDETEEAEDAADDDDEEEFEDEEEEIVITEEEFGNLSKLCSEKMNKVYEYIKKESYRFNLNNVSSAMFENEKVKINEQIYTINHICHIKKKENLFIITPYDPYFVNFIYQHFIKEYNELKFYIKDKSVYAVIPPLSEHLKNEIKNKIKDKIEESKITLRNVRKKFMTKLEKIKNYIGKDIYFKQKNHIQSLHDQTKKSIEKIFNEAI